jgi:hypothetical protein
VAAYQTDKDRHPTLMPTCQWPVVGFGGKPLDPMRMSSMMDAGARLPEFWYRAGDGWEGTVVAAMYFRGGSSVAL